MRKYQPPAAGIAALLFLSAASFAATKQVAGRAACAGAPPGQHCMMDPSGKCPMQSDRGKCPRRASTERKVSGRHACQMGKAQGGAKVQAAGCPMHSGKAQPKRQQSGGQTGSRMGACCAR